MPLIEFDLPEEQIAWIMAQVTVRQDQSTSALGREAIAIAMRDQLATRLVKMMRSAVYEWLEDAEVARLVALTNDDDLLREVSRINLGDSRANEEEGVCMLQPVAPSVPPTSTSTGVLEAIDLTGDTKIHWDKDKEAEVAAARASFDALKAKGYVAFKLSGDGSTGGQLDSFDPSAERILMQPQMRGG
jgi:hypothetical protein